MFLLCQKTSKAKEQGAQDKITAINTQVFIYMYVYSFTITDGIKTTDCIRI